MRRDPAASVEAVLPDMREARVSALAMNAPPTGAHRHDGFCPTCMEVSVVQPDGCCVWCGTQTGAAVAVPSPPGPGRALPPLRAGAPGYGLRCPHCGGAKSAAAHMCRGCRTARGHRTPDRDLGITINRSVCIDDDVLDQARVLYASGLSLREVAALILGRTAYRSLKSCAVGLHGQFRRRGWLLRPRLAAVAASNARRAVTTAPVSRPPCAGTITHGSRRGQACRARAGTGSAYCRAHDPEHAEDVAQALLEARGALSRSGRCTGTVENGRRRGARCLHAARPGQTHCAHHRHQAPTGTPTSTDEQEA